MELEDWAAEKKISLSVIRVLYKEGYTSLDALKLLDEHDLQDINDRLAASQKIPLGQQRLLLQRVQELRRDDQQVCDTDEGTLFFFNIG